jgi:hypothetical protein
MLGAGSVERVCSTWNTSVDLNGEKSRFSLFLVPGLRDGYLFELTAVAVIFNSLSTGLVDDYLFDSKVEVVYLFESEILVCHLSLFPRTCPLKSVAWDFGPRRLYPSLAGMARNWPFSFSGGMVG